jgi:hypothetical protein
MDANTMTHSIPPSTLDQGEYAAIEAAIVQSAKGRAFLNDYLRRNRSAETAMMLESIAKLQRALDENAMARRLESLHADLGRLKRQIEAARQGQRETGSDSIDAACKALDVLRETMRDLSMLGVADEACSVITHQTEVIAACLAAHRRSEANHRRLAATLDQVGAELLAMLELWEEGEPGEPRPSAKPISLDVVRALRKGLAEELSLAMLSEAQKDALFN